APAHSGWLFTSRKCSFGGLYFDIELRLARLRTQPPTKPCRSARNDFAYFALGVVNHAAFIVPDHGLIAIRIAGLPRKAGLTGIAGLGEIRPRCGHLPGQCLGLRRVARALFATQG